MGQQKAQPIQRARSDKSNGYPAALALLEAWFETMELLENNQTQTLADLARLSETSSEDYLAQLRSTELLDSREKALEGMKARELLAATPRISEFLKSRGLAKGDETQWFGIDENSNAILRLNANFLRG